MNWGYRVTFLYLSFVAFMLTMVYMSFQYEVNLVAKDYYKQEMAYQKEIDKMKNVQALEGKVGLAYQKENQMLRLSLPGGATEGEILFFRPSNGKKDFRLALQTDEADEQFLPMAGLEAGLWRLKINWQNEGKAFYAERKIRVSSEAVEVLRDTSKAVPVRRLVSHR
ncbi:MAG: hypothetical protein OHK0053_02920 [Microscillaceae bacterium]